MNIFYNKKSNLCNSCVYLANLNFKDNFAHMFYYKFRNTFCFSKIKFKCFKYQHILVYTFVKYSIT